MIIIKTISKLLLLKFLILIFLLIIVSFLSINLIKAQENLKESTASSITKQIEDFKEKIATKVAQIQKKQDKKAVAGFITQKEQSSLKITTDNNENYNTIVDNIITKYYQIRANKLEEINFSDIKKDDYIIVSGIITDKNINANFIYKDENYFIYKGNIVEVNKEDYYLKIITDEKEEFILDIEVSTKRLILNIKTSVLEGVGFSKIKEGDTVHFVIKKTLLEKKNRYSAEKIIIIPQEFFLLPSN